MHKGEVYNVTLFVDSHPGGPKVILDRSGTDISAIFETIGHSPTAHELLAGFRIGVVAADSNGPAKRSHTSSRKRRHVSAAATNVPSVLTNPLVLLAVGVTSGLFAIWLLKKPN